MASLKSPLRAPLALITCLFALVLPSTALKTLETYSLNACQANSGFTASLFNLRYTPTENKIDVNITAVSTIQAHVEFDVAITAYGISLYRHTLDPCDLSLAGFCPMSSGNLNDPFSIGVPAGINSLLPGIAYSFPDIDAQVKVFINATSGPMAGQSLACLEANVSNGQTVDLVGVKWASAIVAGLAIASSALLSGLGHSNAASHVAATALALTSYFQSQAIIGLVGIPLPPVVQSWTQDFQWSLGIVNVGFLQKIFTWYQRSTGGTAARIIDTLTTVSVQVQKRAEPFREPTMGLFRRAEAMVPRTLVSRASGLMKRGNIKTPYGSYIVFGIQRVAFRARIETTNIFLTGIVSFYVVMVFTAIIVALFKGACELAAKARWIERDTFLEFRNGWLTVLKGILFRLTLIGYAPVSILSFWEFTQRDSPAEVVLAVFFLIYMNVALFWASYKLIRIAHRSVALHKNPAYILFSDPQTLNKWGFLYIQFRASAYYFIVPVLLYTILKALFIAFAQTSPTVQGVALLLIEAGALIGASVLRPWMDKKLNSFNIAICAVNFINSIFLLIFTRVFDQPGIVTGVVGVALWILNAATTLILLLMLIITTIIVFITDNPDGRYKFMADDRTSFMKSQSQLTATGELDALGVTARGEKTGLGLDDNESIRPSSYQQQSMRSRPQSVNKASPVSFATASSTSSAHADQLHHSADQHTSLLGGDGEASQSPSSPSHSVNRAQAGNLWQRGAGYEH
ncbi:hypothetical protein GGR50DRAFT_469280 [Xylaria sp. CBS 124048]|nr:hypothetical protein GGR50DRAFT_469280 [Xylaria sp. CBS 124048]